MIGWVRFQSDRLIFGECVQRWQGCLESLDLITIFEVRRSL
jgi:hypothetical protein